ACDGALTRVLVTRQPSSQPHPDQGDERPVVRDPSRDEGPVAPDPGGVKELGVRLRAAMALLPPALGGAPTQPLEVGRASRVVQSAQRTALAVRDGGCVFPGCARPLAWCEAHHLRHWLHGGPTDLANLALVCRAHHRAVHEEGWRLTRQADGRLTATPPHRPHRPQRRHPTAA
ncbi:MAG TPA: HNH endonuclease signature motif containing protein, partial [Actinomycetota bacterium]